MEDVWDVMCRHLYFMRFAFGVRIYSFVLMSNHFHLLVSTPSANLSEAMRYFMAGTSRDLTSLGNRINQTYGGRYFRCIIEQENHLNHVYKYIYRNPVAAGICDSVERYPYSTLPGLLGRCHLLVPVEEDMRLVSNPQATLDWLNTPHSKENWQTVARALRRRKFWLPQAPNREPHELEISSL